MPEKDKAIYESAASRESLTGYLHMILLERIYFQSGLVEKRIFNLQSARNLFQLIGLRLLHSC